MPIYLVFGLAFLSHMNNFSIGFMSPSSLIQHLYFLQWNAHFITCSCYYPSLLVCFYDKSNLYACREEKGFDLPYVLILHCASCYLLRVTSIGWLIDLPHSHHHISTSHSTFQQNTFFLPTDFVSFMQNPKKSLIFYAM